jgi:hypothetical protein
MAPQDRRKAFWIAGLAALIAAFGLWSLSGDPGRSGAGARPETSESTDGDRVGDTPALESVGASAEATGPRRVDPSASPGSTLDEPSAADGIEASLFDEQARPSRAFMRHAFESAVAESFPDRRLSSDEVERVTDSLMTLRDAKQALRDLPPDEEHAEQRRLLVERIGEASSVFRDVMDISPSEFTTGAEPGLDHHDADEAVPEPEFLDPDR